LHPQKLPAPTCPWKAQCTLWTVYLWSLWIYGQRSKHWQAKEEDINIPRVSTLRNWLETIWGRWSVIR
jgi:hypothetical protein